jgi:predicted dehydrogenase
MSRSAESRRRFLQKSAGLAAAGVLSPYFFSTASVRADEPTSKNDRPNVGCIGNGGMGQGDLKAASQFAAIVAVCDVDRSHAELVAEGGKRTIYEDYRKLLDRKDIDIVTVSTPDHWHAKIAIDAMHAGKDVYCQKPLTLTIDEGKKICRAVKQTGRVFQVGTQQRSEDSQMFIKAVAMCHLGRLGKIVRVTCGVGAGPAGGPWAKADVPTGLNWDQWLGQAPKVDYIPQRCHGSFRWWYEYSGGKLTDWGAHHVDIAQWAIGMDQSGPLSVEPLAAVHPQPLASGMPTRDDCYSTANTFRIKCTFAGAVELILCDTPVTAGLEKTARKLPKRIDNGILIEGEKGQIFVNRSILVGPAVDELENNPLPEDYLTKLRKGKPVSTHMGNFMACVKDRGTPISDVFTHHRTLSTCHLANLAIRLGRKLNWDPEREQIVGDEKANAWQSRPQRKGFEIEG